MKVIGLGLNRSNKRGYTDLCYIDDKDYEFINQFRWSKNSNGYIMTRIKNKPFLIHRLIMNITNSNIDVDHINKNKIDNTRNNLRLCVAKQNLRNTGPLVNSKSGIRGVSWDKINKCWRCQIRYENKVYNLVLTKYKELAAKTYAYFDKKIGGDFHSSHPYYDPKFYPTQLTPKGLELFNLFK